MTTFEKYNEEFKDDPEFHVYGVLLHIVTNMGEIPRNLSEKSGLAYSTIEKFLNANDPRVSLLTLSKIAKALGKELFVEFRNKEETK